MSGFYPALLDMAGRRAVVVGGGAVAARKARTLVKAGAKVTLISPELTPALAALARKGVLTHRARRYRKGDLNGAALAVAAAGDPRTNERVASDAKALNVWVNSANPPAAGSFIVPSSIQKGGITVAISTGGACPALSKRLRKDIESFLGAGYGPFLDFLKEARETLKMGLPDEKARGNALSRLVNSDILERFGKPGRAAALKYARARLGELVCAKNHKPG